MIRKEVMESKPTRWLSLILDDLTVLFNRHAEYSSISGRSNG